MEKYLKSISEALGRNPSDISGITLLGTGMTNSSCIFSMDGRRYVLRMPGKGTDLIIDRRKELDVYEALKGTGISEKVVYFSIPDGIKISEYLENSRNCDPDDPEDVRKCMAFLRDFHCRELEVAHSVDIFERIEYYESLWRCSAQPFAGYEETREKVFRLDGILDSLPRAQSLTHMDAVPGNFIIAGGEIRLIDWEYSAMQDPLADVALFALHSMYGREQLDMLLDSYFTEGCPDEARFKVCCYIAACGLMNSNWCGYMRLLGGEFGDYSKTQYEYAKEYSEIALKLKKPPARR
jgi:thiamine kinase-like enzyme